LKLLEERIVTGLLNVAESKYKFFIMRHSDVYVTSERAISITGNYYDVITGVYEGPTGSPVALPVRLAGSSIDKNNRGLYIGDKLYYLSNNGTLLYEMVCEKTTAEGELITWKGNVYVGVGDNLVEYVAKEGSSTDSLKMLLEDIL
jgi:hypothetical protein